MNKYKQLTLEQQDKWNNSFYPKFLSNSTIKEFLQSQIPFYFAVESFPRMLLKLASIIPNSEQRLLLIDNIYEEHGRGNPSKFHTTTFKEHLNILGFNGEFKKNPFIEDWISSIEKSNFTIDQFGSYLAGIEYLYALICVDIVNFMNLHNIASPHYQKHSEIDWDHGAELLHVVLNCNLTINDEYFLKAQSDFIELFNKMPVPTQKELEEISKHPISFFYSREDSNVEKQVLKKYLNNEKTDVFMICSGGEHILEMLSLGYQGHLTFDIFDVNYNQINVFKNKLTNKEQEAEGKFELLFEMFRTMYFDEREQDRSKYFYHNSEKFDYVMELLFNNQNLNTIFSESATKYSSASFSEHFKKAFLFSFQIQHQNIKNIFHNKPLHISYLNSSSFCFNFIVDNILNYSFDKNYDIIDLSNIGDWMDVEDYALILESAKKHLNPNGSLIVRKLLGDYSLKQLLKDSGFVNIEDINDYTYFYTECLVATS